jgi:hypothetical protein
LALVFGCFSDYGRRVPVEGKKGAGAEVAASSGSKAASSTPTADRTAQRPGSVAGASQPPQWPSSMSSGTSSPSAAPPGQTPPPAMPGSSTPAISPPGPPGAQGVAIGLSAGVALPQTGPEGTMMGFSVDYQFIQGQPHPSESFFWVIERAQGAPERVPRRLQPKGTLEGFITSGWRPEQGPFRTHIEDSRGRRVSETVDLRAP